MSTMQCTARGFFYGLHLFTDPEAYVLWGAKHNTATYKVLGCTLTSSQTPEESQKSCGNM